jgi:hypothetical protein
MGAPLPAVSVATPAEFCSLPGLTPLDGDAVARQAPDASWVGLGPDGAAARCSLWWSRVPVHGAHRIGLIGHYAAASSAAGERLLAHACAELAAHGCTLAIGPMDGTTYGRYRLITQRGSAPPFFLEPDNPDDYPQHFVSAGLTPFASYCSAIQTELHARPLHLPDIMGRLARRQVWMRSLDGARLDEELRRLYPVAMAAFARSPLYTPISADEFVNQYRQLGPYLVPALVAIAECEERAVGFLFALPNWLQQQRGERLDTVILKTVCVLPEYAGTGVVGLLLARGQDAAHELGFTRVIHALMHERNSSLRMSGRYGGQVMRRYALFARPIGVRA